MVTFARKFLWTLPFICFASGYFLLTKLYPVKEIQTPAVVGKNLQEACTLLAQHSLNCRLVALKEDPLLPASTVISQNPQAGQKIKPNQTVFIVASTHPEKNVAPDFVLKNMNEIEADLNQKNIRAKTYQIPSALKENSCVAQWPEAGLTLENNKMILYCAHQINKPIIMPNLKNKKVSTVTDFLTQNNITFELVHESIIENAAHECSECTVIEQRPLAGSIITLDPQKKFRIQLQVR